MKRVEMTFPTVAYGNVRLIVEADDMATLRSEIAELKFVADEFFGTYVYVQGGPTTVAIDDHTHEQAVEDVKATLPATEVPDEPTPQADPDRPFWERKSAPEATPTPVVPAVVDDLFS